MCLRLLTFLSLILLSSIPFANAVTPVVILADDDYAPFSMKTLDGQADGVYVRILREAFAQLDGYEVVIKPVPWKRGLKHIRQGRAFAIFPPYFWPEQRPYMAPYSEPILNERVVVACREEVLDNNPRPTWPGDYHGLTIANNDGFLSPGQSFFDAVDRGDIKLREVRDVEGGIAMLANGRVDCYVNGDLAIQWVTKQLIESKKLHASQTRFVVGADVAANEGYVGYSRDGNFDFKDDFRQRLDAVLSEMRSSGRIDAIVKSYMNR